MAILYSYKSDRGCFGPSGEIAAPKFDDSRQVTRRKLFIAAFNHISKQYSGENRRARRVIARGLATRQFKATKAA